MADLRSRATRIEFHDQPVRGPMIPADFVAATRRRFTIQLGTNGMRFGPQSCLVGGSKNWQRRRKENPLRDPQLEMRLSPVH